MSDAQVATVAIATWLSGTLSLIGSCFLIYIVMKKRRSDGYHRILLGLSVVDLFHTIGWMMGPVAVPRETTDRFIAIGNKESCSAAGFLVQLGASSYLYNAMLSVYFLVVIRFGIGPQTLITVEWIMHAVAIVFGLATAPTGLYLKVYSESAVGSLCWIAESPVDCSLREGVECVNEANIRFVGYLFGILPMLSVPIVVVCNLLIYCWVRSTEQARQRHDRSADCGDEGKSEIVRLKRTRKVANQAFLYVAAFFNSLMWTIVVRNLDGWNVVTRENEGNFFVLILLGHCFSPLQGFFNLLVYIRPRYLNTRLRYKHESRLGALHIALSRVQSREARRSSLVSNTQSTVLPCSGDGEETRPRRARRHSITSIVLLEERGDDVKQGTEPAQSQNDEEARVLGNS